MYYTYVQAYGSCLSHVVDTCNCSRSFPLPEDFWLMYKLMYISCLLTVTSQSITYWYCLHRMWHWCCSKELSPSAGTIICINSCVTHWFVGIVQCLRGFVMEFLLLWVLSGNILDSGMRYEDAGSCYADAQNSGMELREIGLNPPKFTCVAVAKGKDLRLVVPATPRSTFPFNWV